MAWSPDGNLLATASYDRTARIWNLDGTTVFTLNGHTGPVERIQWRTDHRIFTGSTDQTSRVWDDRTGRLLETTYLLPDSNSITVGNTGEVLRRTERARELVSFVVERPQGEQPEPMVETLSWTDFERAIGIPLERPQKPRAPSGENLPSGESVSGEENPPADATAPANVTLP